jgi:hypothetical protein
MLEQARRRCRDEALVREGSWAAAAGLAGFCALLLAGTQVLDWRWPASLALAAFAWAAWRVHRATPANDRLALRLDGALDTGDLFATAVHYRDARPAREPDPVFLASLNGSAERSAASVDVSHALPGKWPRSASAAVAGLLAAASLFFLRYGLLHTFDLSAPLAAVEFDTLTGAPAARRKAPPKEMARMNVPGVEPLEIPAEEQSNWTQEQLAEQKMQTVRSPDPTQASRQGQKDISSGQEGDEAQGEDTEGEGSKGSDDPNSPAGATDPSKGGDKSSPKDRGDEKNSSLMDKMRDALANLMDKLKVDSKGGETKTAANKGQQSQKMEKGQNSRGQNQQAEEADPGQQGDQPGEGDSPQQAKSQAGADQDTPSKNEKSGVGKQDGSKDTQLAEQREAMGKLSEVLGKRALNVQGEVMVEVNNSRNQQLKTPYVNRTAQHADSGGDISRDEVPLELRDYVQKYYESVRKPAPAKQ